MSDPILSSHLLYAVTEGPGRGDNPSEAGGVLIIVGIVVLVALLAFLAMRLVISFSRRR